MSAQTPSKPEARLPTMKALDDLDGALPSYSELPYSDVLKARYCWGLFGEADEIGTMNLLTPRRVKAALGRVSEGLRVNLSLPLNEPSPAPPSRGSYVHHIHTGNLNSLDDYVDNFYLQGSSQWDALRHIRAREFGYYNGYREPEVGPDGRHLGIDRIAEHGIFCRGVLVDVAGYHARHGKPLDPTVGHPITVDDLKAVMDEENVSLEAGDLLVVRTGWLAALLAGDAAERERIMTTRAWPGLHAGEAMAEFLWDSHVVGIASDNRAVEMAPGDPSVGFLHRRVLALLGMSLAEIWNLEELARTCAARGQFDFLVASIPLNLPSGCGSPANAVAIF